MSDNRCRCLIGCFLIIPGVGLGFGVLWLKMSCPAQDGGLPKGIKYYILYLACTRSGGDALTPVHNPFMGCIAIVHHCILGCMTQFFLWSSLIPSTNCSHTEYNKNMVSLSFLQNPTPNLSIRLNHTQYGPLSLYTKLEGPWAAKLEFYFPQYGL